MCRKLFLKITIISILSLAGLFSCINVVEACSSGTKIFLPVVQSSSSNPTLPTIEQFIQSVGNDQPDQVTGVYAAGDFALKVQQQPEGNYNFISTKPDVVTQYDLAEQLGVIGLLAHNYLAGSKFFLLNEGENITIVFGNGNTMSGQVVGLYRYQALSPRDAFSSLKDLDTGDLLSSAQVFLKYYGQKGMIVFQTCISEDGNSSWGRLFVVAKPVL